MNTKERVMQFINARDWQGMKRMLSSLSNTEFRRMESAIRTSVLPELDNGLFWETLLHLIIFKRAAFITGATAIGHLVENGSLSFENDAVKAIYSHLKDTAPDSLTKMVNMMMPIVVGEEQVNSMFANFHIDDEMTRLKILLKVESPMSYYVLFKTLKMMDDKSVARRCALIIIKRNNDMAFNAASLIKTYWDIDDMPARFSLHIEPYELNHIDQNYNNFVNILHGKSLTL